MSYRAGIAAALLAAAFNHAAAQVTVGEPVVVTATRFSSPGGQFPIGVQVIAAPWREDLCFRVAGALVASGASFSPAPAALE